MMDYPISQMSMNPRKGTVTLGIGAGTRYPTRRSDEHESSEGDCDTDPGLCGLGLHNGSDEHESSEGDCDHWCWS